MSSEVKQARSLPYVRCFEHPCCHPDSPLWSRCNLVSSLLVRAMTTLGLDPPYTVFVSSEMSQETIIFQNPSFANNISWYLDLISESVSRLWNSILKLSPSMMSISWPCFRRQTRFGILNFPFSILFEIINFGAYFQMFIVSLNVVFSMRGYSDFSVLKPWKGML